MVADAKTIDQLDQLSSVTGAELVPVDDGTNEAKYTDIDSIKAYTKDGLQASDIVDFDTEVSNNTSVANATTHISRTDNPHTVTKTQVGLGNVPNIDTTTTANITDSTDKRFITDAQQVVLSSTSGVNTGDQDLSGLVTKTTKVNGKALNTDITLTYSDVGAEPTRGADDNYVTDAEKIVIGNTSGTNTGDNATNSQYSGLATSKQDTLVSGSNIKTINSQSVLGSGDITISGTGHTIEDEGTPLTARGKLNFVGAGVTVTDGGVGTDDTIVTIPGGSASDEKVKYDAGDPTAGYVADKFVAGTGITVAEGTGGDENKLKITNSAPDQTVSIAAGTNITSVTGTYPNFTVNAATQTTDISGKVDKLTVTALKNSNYSANANEYIPCDISGGNFIVTLPTAPAEGTRVQVVITVQGTGIVEVKCGGSDVLTKAGGSTSTYLNLYIENYMFQYKSGIWYVTPTASPSNFATNFPGIDAQTPIINTDISLNTTTKVLTITPPLGYFYTYADGNGKIIKTRHVGTINFPAWTDTSGLWYFYFDATGTAVTSQTPRTDFGIVAPVYRILWNRDLFKFTVTAATATLGDTYTNNGSTFRVTETIAGGTTLICERTAGTNDPAASGNLVRATGAGTDPIVFSAWNDDAKLVAQYIEYHLNDIPAASHLALHLDGSRREHGLAVSSNALTTGTPNTDGRNTVVALSTGTVLDDNLPYTVTNDSTPTDPRQQDLGDTTPASLNATNSALFKIYTQNAAGEISFLPATRFPFAWNATSNRPETISSTGVRTVVPDNRWFVYFIYSTQNPVAGESIKIVSAPSEFTSLANAQSYTWSSIQALYPSVIGSDNEIRPLYRIIFYNDNSGGGAFPAGCKYSVIREIQDIRKGSVTSTAVATGSIAASAVTVVPSGNIAATNVQTALEELDAEKVATSTTITINGVTYDLSTDRSWTVSASADPGVMAIAMINS